MTTAALSPKTRLIQAAPPAAPKGPPNSQPSAPAPRRPRSEEVLITPELATKWLNENMRTNRPISNRVVAGYAKDMAAGAWTLNGESIKFDLNEEMIDGQHRLYACIESGASFRSVVTWDLPTNAFATIDTGKRRSASDAMHFAGYADTQYKTSIAAAIRLILSYRAGAETMRQNIPNAEVLEFLRKEPTLSQVVGEVRHALDRPLHGMTSPVAAVVYLASRSGPSYAEFIQKLGSGENLTRTSPILTLRNKLLSMPHNRDPRERFWSIVIAWNAHVDGKTLQIIRIPQEPPKIKGAA